MDVTTLEPGVDFVEAIQGAVGKCEILIRTAMSCT
jgi:hypothetical protein